MPKRAARGSRAAPAKKPAATAEDPAAAPADIKAEPAEPSEAAVRGGTKTRFRIGKRAAGVRGLSARGGRVGPWGAGFWAAGWPNSSRGTASSPARSRGAKQNEIETELY
jgi:hypothetical protein